MSREIKPAMRRQKIVTYRWVERKVPQCEPFYVKLGQIVRDKRHDLGWSQMDLADKTMWSRGTVANIETGRQRVLAHDIVRLAKILGIKPIKIFEACL